MSDYLARMRESIRRFEDAERAFAEVTAECVRRYGMDGEYQASVSQTRRRAQADAVYYGRRATMYALAHLVDQGSPVVVPAPEWPADSSCAPEGAWPGVTR